jgi:YjjG family noncanonical pyrimidine nucleotidase
MYETLLFDFDHTLFDSDASEALAFVETLRDFGVLDPNEYFATYQKINQSLWVQVEQGSISPNDVRTERFAHLAKVMNLDADPIALADRYVAAMGTNGELYPGAFAVLEQLAASATLALVTNALSEVQRTRIARIGIEHFFSAIVISGEVGPSKPNPAIYDITFALLGQPTKERTLMIGDSLSSDIKGGTNYGIDTCWYNVQGKTASPSDRVTHEIASLEQLLPFVATRT